MLDESKRAIPAQVQSVIMLPDNSILTDAREMVIQSGYDHYWRFHSHDRIEEWVKFGCPICKGKEVIKNDERGD